MRVHLDTDIGTTMDDLAALVMLLGSPDVEVTAITTCIDPGGRRAGYVHQVLRSAGRDDIPVAAGAEVSMTTAVTPGEIPDDERRWPELVPPAPGPAGAASRLLADSIEAGATIVAIGPLTNLALLAVERPDVIARAHAVMMGGWFHPAPEGLPPWGPARDWNVQCDTTAARLVIDHAGTLTMVPLSLTIRAFLCCRHLKRLRAAGPLGRLLASQAEHQAAERSTGELARSSAGLPADLLAFHHDPLTCAAALGWPGVTIADRRLAPVYDGDLLLVVDSDQGRAVRVAVDVDAHAFGEMWLSTVEVADRRRQSR